MTDLKILLADDHPILLKGLVSFLKEKGYEQVIAAPDGAEAWRLIQEVEPDICILDIEMPGLTGLDILERCKKAALETKIILLSYHNEPEFVALARQKGVAGYLGKENSVREIEDCIRRVHVDGFYFPGDLSGDYVAPGKDIIRIVESLTHREREVLSLLRRRETNRSIAEQLRISLRTVEKHRDNISSKLGIKDSDTTLSTWVLQNDLLLQEVL